MNKALDRVGNAAVKDDIPDGLSLDTASILVHELDVNLDGSVTAGNILDSSKYDLTSSTPDELNLKFTESPMTKAYRIEFVTDITSAGADATSYANTAVFSGGNGFSKESTVTVTAGRGKPLNKMAAGYDEASQTISWAIEYNYNQKLIPASNAVLKDSLNATQELIPSSLKVFPVTIEPNGKVVKGGTPLPDTDYTITTSVTASTYDIEMKFNNNVKSAYRIEYQTKAKNRVFDNDTITNKVTYNGETVSASQGISQQILFKNYSNIDYLNKTVKWTITVNKDSKIMNDLIVKDTFSNAGLKLVKGSLVIQPIGGGAAVSNDVVYTAHDPAAANDGFTITFDDPISEPYVISYTTTFNYDWLSAGKDRFINTAGLEWYENGAATPSGKTVTSTLNPRGEVKNNGLKNGSYDATTKRITWNIGANYNMKTLANAVLEDTIAGGQIVDMGSVKVFKWVYGANGNPSTSSNVSKDDYAVVMDSGKLKISFNKEIGYAFYVSFQTSFADQAIDLNKVDNTAVLYNGTTKESADLSASVNIPQGENISTRRGPKTAIKLTGPSTSTATNHLLKML